MPNKETKKEKEMNFFEVRCDSWDNTKVVPFDSKIKVGFPKGAPNGETISIEVVKMTQAEFDDLDAWTT